MIHYESRNKVKPTNKNKHFQEKLFFFAIKKCSLKTFQTKTNYPKFCDENGNLKTSTLKKTDQKLFKEWIKLAKVTKLISVKNQLTVQSNERAEHIYTQYSVSLLTDYI